MQNAGPNRRTAVIAAASLLLSRHVSATDAEGAPFWTVTPTGRKGAVLFGYMPIAAALVPDIIKDGEALVARSQLIALNVWPRRDRTAPRSHAANDDLSGTKFATEPISCNPTGAVTSSLNRAAPRRRKQKISPCPDFCPR
jgi:hypothetical protein